MDTNERLEQLKSVALLKRQIAQDKLVTVMFNSGHRANKPFDKLTTWLLAGTGAAASLLIGNADKIIPILTKSGFLTVGILLSTSVIFGIVSKYYAVLYDLGRSLSNDIQTEFPKILDQYSAEQLEIEGYAKSLKTTIDTDVQLDEVMKKFLEPMPWWVRLKVSLDQKKPINSIHQTSFRQVRLLNSQLTAATIQIFLALAAMGTAFVFASVV